MKRSRKSYRPGLRLRGAALAGAGLIAVLVGLAVDVSARQAAFNGRRTETHAVVQQLGFADLALSSSARWLRTPSQSERSAPLTDAPLAFDTDPAGAVLGPVE